MFRAVLADDLDPAVLHVAHEPINPEVGELGSAE
ncbi:hypothetical protein SDC9_200472 [bioreactor metagenome]|uniref:Uncharacterized protein n=1 Tax=bioreactor metagenome TaxID=1076179 RepID=A0A645IR46_9ZZZZ